MLLANLSNIKFSTRYLINDTDMIRYEQVLELQYTAGGSPESVIILTGLVGALRIIQIEKEIKPIFDFDYTANFSSGQLNLLNGVELGPGETLFILYVNLITA